MAVVSTRQALEIFVGALRDDPNLHKPCVLVLERDGATIRRELLPEKVLGDSMHLLWELHFDLAPVLGQEAPRAVALVLPVEHVPARQGEHIDIVDPERGIYSLLLGAWTPVDPPLGMALTPDGLGDFDEGKIDNDPQWLTVGAPLGMCWGQHPWPLHGSLAKPTRGRSALQRFVEREMPEGFAFIEPLTDFLRGCTPVEQVLVWEWARLRGALRALWLQRPELEPLLDRLQQESHRYQGEDERGYGALALAVIAGTEADDDTPHLGALRHGLGLALRAAHEQGLARFQPYSIERVLEAVRELDLDDVDDEAVVAFANDAGGNFLHLLYIHECSERQAIMLGGSERPLPDDPDECVAYLMRLVPILPVTIPSPALGRMLPTRSDRLFPLSGSAHARLARDCPEVDPDFGLQLAHEIYEQRRYALDHVAIVDVDGFGIRRITLAPEHHSDEQTVIGFLVEHRLGVFGGELILDVEPGEERDNLTVQIALPFVAGAEEEERIAPAVELMVLAVWRDLVVPQVIEEQYETEVLRTPKDKGRAERKKRKGDVAIVRYLPRRIVLRRAEQEARKERGAPALRELYWVGAFARRLGDKEHRTYEADEYAREIGIPLQSWQTVVRPHPRGGTAEERQQAKAEPPEVVRHWRSWSALDLLRTRGAVKAPVS